MNTEFRANRLRCLSFTAALLSLLLTAVPASAADLLVYFNFNDSGVANGQPATAAALQSDLTANPPPNQTTMITSNFPSSDLQVAAGSSLNLAPGDTTAPPTGAGQALSLTGGSFAGGATGNNGDYIQFTANTTGLGDLSLTYATRSTPSAFLTETLSFSLDGINFTTDGTYTSPRDNKFNPATFDLSPYDTIENQATVYFRITLSGATNANATTQLDNIQLKRVPEPSTWIAAALALGAIACLRRRASPAPYRVTCKKRRASDLRRPLLPDAFGAASGE